jgi:hypothetical protein
VLTVRLLRVASLDNDGGFTVVVVVVEVVVEVVVVVVLDTGFTAMPLCAPVIGEYSPVRVAVTD